MVTDTVRATRRPRSSTTLIALALGFVPATAVHSAEWELSPRLLVSQSWTDNVRLAPSGSESSEWVTEVKPGFRLQGASPRVSTQFDYDLQGLWFADDSDLNDIYHQALGRGTLEILQRQLFLDGFLRFDQQNIDPAGRIGHSNIYNTGNRADTLVFSVSPYHVGRWGSWGESLLRVQRQGVRYSGYDENVFRLQDSDTTAASFALGSPSERRGFSWRASGSTSTTEFEIAPDFAFDQVKLEIGVPVGLRTRLIASGGLESDIIEDREQGGLDASTWSVGIAWEPSELQSLEARVGERYYGSAYQFRWTRRGSRGSLSVDYSEDPTTSSGVLSDDGAFDPGFRPGGVPRLDTRVLLRKRLSGRATYEFTRTTLGARVYAQRQIEAGGAGDSERNYGATFNVDWDAGQRTQVGAQLDWETREFAGSNREDDLADFSIRVSRQLTRQFNANFAVGHLLRNSDGGSTYDATRVSISLIGQF